MMLSLCSLKYPWMKPPIQSLTKFINTTNSLKAHHDRSLTDIWRELPKELILASTERYANKWMGAVRVTPFHPFWPTSSCAN